MITLAIKYAIAERKAGKQYFQPLQVEVWQAFKEVLHRPTLTKKDLEFLDFLGVKYKIDKEANWPDWK